MRIIAHLDMDAFFASLEEAGSEIFYGKPIVVGADPKGGYGRGVVSTANYKAREYGIKSALPISRAWQLSQKAKSERKPEAIFVQPDFERYEKASREVFGIIKKHCDLVEPASIDEFYFDLSSGKSYKKAEKICLKIKQEIKEKLKVTCSVGIGPNKLIAKISAGIKKPDGLFLVKAEEAEKFLEPLPIREIPGIGPKTEKLFNDKGIKIVKDLKKFSENNLISFLGKLGEDIYDKARGIDNLPIIENRTAKSIGEQATFQQNSLNFIYIGEVFDNLCKSVFKRFINSDFKSFKTIAITVRFSDFETKTTAKTLAKPISKEKDFKLESLRLLLPYSDRRKNPHQKLIRLIGVKIEKFNE
ncbi:MAG: DNA polymerase IV [Patescibacteria group bacterium]